MRSYLQTISVFSVLFSSTMESSSALKRKASSSLALVYVKKSAPLDNLNPRSQSITVGSDQDEGENEKRFNDATLEVRQRQKVTIAIPPKNFDFVLSLPKVSGRKCTMKSLGPKGQNYKLIIIESGTTSFLADIKKYGKGYLSQLSLVFARVSYTMEQVERMVPLLLRLLDRWPWANVSASALVQYVTIYSLPNSTLHYPPIGSSKSTEYNTSIICIDPDTGKPNKLNLHADSSRATAMKIPTIAPNIAFNTSKSKITEKDGPTENLVESYLKFLSSQLHLRVTSLENAKLLRGAYGREYGYDEIRGYGPYNGVDIWRISQEDRARTIVWPTHQLKSDIQGSLPLISVGSTDRVYILPVINAILQTWVSSEDILPAWKNGCRMADSINAAILDGEPSINICSCENPAVSTAVHPCARCLYIARCAEMQQNQQGLGICSRCGQTEEKAPAKRRRAKASTQYLPASTHDGHKVIFISLTNNIHSEASRCGVSSEIASTRIMPAWEDIQRYALTDGQWQDAYCSVRRRGTNTGKNPFQPSPDAIFPYTIVDGEIRYHAPGNIVVTSLYLNFFKYAYIPAMLAHVVKYLKSDRGAMALKDFLGEMANVYLVGMKTPFFKKKRLENVPSDAAYAATRQEWITGLPRGQVHDGARYTRKHYVGNCSAEPCAGWVPEGIDRIANLILQIERRFPAETLRRGPDGCPFPFHEPTMPVDWSWWTCWQMINKRICRMKWWCNKKWDCMFYPILLNMKYNY